tara:strand:+ start:81 stop:311 length:231 start_codon:yes stop_codon:yes gene_type:complete
MDEEISKEIIEELAKRPVGTVYFYGGDSECKLEMDKEFMKNHPVMVVDWMNDIIWEAEQERDSRILKMREKKYPYE